MTEEVKLDAPNSEEQVEQKTGPSEIEQRALEMGWRPKEEFDGNEDDFIDAKEFVRRKPLFDKIDHLSRQHKATMQALNDLKTHYTKVKETEYNRALADLKKERREALREGDADRFEELDDEIDRIEEAAKEIKVVAETHQEPITHPEFVSWLSRNPWYNTTAHMRVFADDVGTRLAAQGLEPAEVLKKVEKAVREEFPNKFRNPNKDNAPNVESSGNKGSKASSGFSEADLDDRERKVMNNLVRQKLMTKEEYLADLKKIKGEKR